MGGRIWCWEGYGRVRTKGDVWEGGYGAGWDTYSFASSPIRGVVSGGGRVFKGD